MQQQRNYIIQEQPQLRKKEKISKQEYKNKNNNNKR